MLGLATAVAVLALLLAGTFNGLWAYHLTMKSIAAKLNELDAAETLIREVAKLAPPDRFETPIQVVYKLKDKSLPDANAALDNFERAFRATLELDLELTPDDGAQLAGLIEAMRAGFSTLQGTCEVAAKELADGRLVVNAGNSPFETFRPHREKIQDQAKGLADAADDLRGDVRKHLMERIHRSRRHYQTSIPLLITASVAGILLMVGGLRFFYGWIFTPIRDLQNGVIQVARGDFEHRIEVHSGDEMEELAEAYNDMTCRLRDLYREMATQINERSRQLVRSERLASVGFLAAGVALCCRC
jgi:HAMP domain-containing protein